MSNVASPRMAAAALRADYIARLLGRCLKEGADPAEIIEPGAIELLAARLRTPLQIE